MSDYGTRQQPPLAGRGPEVWPLVAADFALRLCNCPELRDGLVADALDRDTLGRQHYGEPLRVEGERDALVDGYQESMDTCVYLRQAEERARIAGDDVQRARLHDAYVDALCLAEKLRGLLLLRDGR